MWPFGKHSARRKEIRRSKTERGFAWHQRLFSRVGAVPAAITVGSAITAALLVNAGPDPLNLHVGQTVPRAVVSRVEFRVGNEARTIEMRLRARDNTPNYYELDVSLLNDIRGRLTNALQLAKAHLDDPARFQDEARRSRLILDDEGRQELLRIARLTDPAEWQRAADRFQSAVEEAVYRLAEGSPLLVEPLDPANRRTAANAILIDPRGGGDSAQRVVPVSRLLPANQPEAAETVAAAAAAAFRQALQPSMRASIAETLRGEADGSARPIYRFAAEKSNHAAQEAAAAVPIQYDVYPPGRQVADAGVITEEEHRLLRREHESYVQWLHTASRLPPPEELERLRQVDPRGYERLLADQQEAARALSARRWQIAGYGVLAMLVPVGLTYYLSRGRTGPRVDPSQQLLTAVVLLLVLAVARLAYVTTARPPYAIGVQAFAAALLGVVYTRGSVSAVTGGLAPLITLAARQGLGYFISLLAVSMTLLFGLREVRSRGKIVAVGLGASLVALLSTTAAALVDAQTLRFALVHQALPAALTTLAAAVVIEGILPGIERLFKISTSVSLLEWCDASKPLLRLLATEAPGTYNHSLVVGTLAEAAAEAIGSRGLLARTGAYYHDIGKINKPEYFAENQAVGASPHDRLSPAMSHLVIIGHVKDGIEMAKEYGLPASLHPFIAEHHGTTVIEYFYHAANRLRKPGDPEVTDLQFRYPGLKPQSRETAIVMLADGAEGAVRSLAEPTPARIEDTVAKIVERRLTDGQLDECDLTFRELALIQRSLVKSLCAIYHSRVSYPEREEEKKGAAARAS